MASEREVMKRHIIASCLMSLFVIGYIATVGLFVFQLVNKIFHIIPAVAVVILSVIAVPVVKDMFTPHKTTEIVKKNGKKTTRKTVSGRLALGETRSYSVGSVLTPLIMALIIAVLGVVSFTVMKKKEAQYTSVVTAEVVDYRVDTTTKTETKHDRVETTESSVIVLSLAYEFEGQLIRTTHTLGTTAKKFMAKEIQVCLNDAGEIVATYDGVKMLKIATWICAAMAVYYLILAIFGFPIGCSILGIFFAVGVALFFLLNNVSLSNWMYNELTVFCFMFATCGSMGFVGFLNVIFLPPTKEELQRAKERSEISPRLAQEGVENFGEGNNLSNVEPTTIVSPVNIEGTAEVKPVDTDDVVSATDISELRKKFKNKNDKNKF